MNKSEIHYVCTLWEGKRRSAGGTPEYLPYQLDALKRFEHNLSRIWFVFNGERRSSQTIPSRIQDTEVSVVYRPNVGISYGALAEIHAKRPTSGFYLFIEDDYVPALDHFDQHLIDIMAELPNCGWLCSRVSEDWGMRHAGISTGLLRASCLDAIASASSTGSLPHTPANFSDPLDARTGQLALSQAVVDTGYTIEDTTSHYRSVYWDGNVSRDYAKEHEDALFLPVQTYHYALRS